MISKIIQDTGPCDTKIYNYEPKVTKTINNFTL